MKKIAFLLVCVLTMNLTALAANDKPIQVSKMPAAAQQFIRKYFSSHSVAMAKMETDFLNKSYDVIFTNGDKVEFDNKGNWTNIDCERSAVPVEVVPAAIKEYVQKSYPDTKPLQLEKTDRKGYELKLSNGVEIEFDKKFRVIDLDR